MRLRAQSDMEWKLYGDSLSHLRAMEVEYTRQMGRRQEVADVREYAERKQAEERARFAASEVGKAYPGATDIAEARVLQDKEQAEQRITADDKAKQRLEEYKKAILADMETNGASVAEMELVRVADKDSDIRMAYAQFASRRNAEANRTATAERADKRQTPTPWDIQRQASIEWTRAKGPTQFDYREKDRLDADKTGRTAMERFTDDYREQWEESEQQRIEAEGRQAAAAGSALQPQPGKGQAAAQDAGSRVDPHFTQAVAVLRSIAETGEPEAKLRAQRELDRLAKEGLLE